MAEDKIGVYFCHCGTNIAGKVDVADVVEWAATQPGVVVAREYKYMCSDPGQDLIKNDIQELGLNRVVVAACSPTMHEPTFRKAAGDAGLNPFLLQMANVREHCSWVTVDPVAATAKAKRILSAQIHRLPYNEPLNPIEVAVNPDVLVVGGGIAGIEAALKLAEAGKHVYMVERNPSIGGHMAMFDKTFPTLDCAACILTPKMSALGKHPNITLMAYSEVTEVDGYVGNFKVKVTQEGELRRQRQVHRLRRLPGGLRRAQGKERVRPGSRVPQRDLHPLPPGRAAARHDRPREVPHAVEGQVQTAGLCRRLRAGRHRLRAAGRGGRSRGRRHHHGNGLRALRLQDRVQVRLRAPRQRDHEPRVRADVERVGTRPAGTSSARTAKRPSRSPSSTASAAATRTTRSTARKVCCMYSLKFAHLIRENLPEAEIYELYIDMRTFGKGYEEFYKRLMNEDVNFIRGSAAEVSDVALTSEEEGKLIVKAEDTLLGIVRRLPVDMVVLSAGLEPPHDAKEVAQVFGFGCSASGFFLERHPKLEPVATVTDGIFIAGACQCPKDIPDTVAQAGAAAAGALTLVEQRDGQGRADHLLHRPGEVLRLPHLRWTLPTSGDPVRRGEEASPR